MRKKIEEYAKHNKKLISIIAALVIVIIIVVCNIVSHQFKNNITLGVAYLPKESDIVLDCGELSSFIDPLVYPSLIKINKDDNENILAQKVETTDSTITVTLNGNFADDVINTYLFYGHEFYDDNYKCENIKGYKEYENSDIEKISGIEKVDDKTIKFTVLDSTNLDFLTIPIIYGDHGEFKIVSYKEYDSILLSNGKTKITIKKANKDDNKIDLYITGNIEIKKSNKYNIYNIYRNYDYIGIVNYPKDQVETLKEIINGKELKDNNGIGAVYFWSDASYNATKITDNLNECFEKNEIEFRLDFAENSFVKQKVQGSDKFLFYYTNDSSDKQQLSNKNVEFIKVDSKPIHLFYKKDVKNFVKKYFS